MRIATFDIETTQLDATYGRILCACFKFTDEDQVRTVKAPRYKDEPRALAKIVEIYNKADIFVTWNGKMFDVPFVNARLMIRRNDDDRLPSILDPKKFHIDLMWMCKKLRTRGSRMDGAAKDLRTRHQKYDVPGEDWIRAADGDRDALDRIVRHCEFDVEITEDLLDRFRPYLRRITT